MPDMKQLVRVLKFFGDNREFFAAPFTDQMAFRRWAENDRLKRVLPEREENIQRCKKQIAVGEGKLAEAKRKKDTDEIEAYERVISNSKMELNGLEESGLADASAFNSEFKEILALAQINIPAYQSAIDALMSGSFSEMRKLLLASPKLLEELSKFLQTQASLVQRWYQDSEEGRQALVTTAHQKRVKIIINESRYAEIATLLSEIRESLRSKSWGKAIVQLQALSTWVQAKYPGKTAQEVLELLPLFKEMLGQSLVLQSNFFAFQKTLDQAKSLYPSAPQLDLLAFATQCYAVLHTDRPRSTAEQLVAEAQKEIIEAVVVPAALRVKPMQEEDLAAASALVAEVTRLQRAFVNSWSEVVIMDEKEQPKTGAINLDEQTDRSALEQRVGQQQTFAEQLTNVNPLQVEKKLKTEIERVSNLLPQETVQYLKTIYILQISKIGSPGWLDKAVVGELAQVIAGSLAYENTHYLKYLVTSEELENLKKLELSACNKKLINILRETAKTPGDIFDQALAKFSTLYFGWIDKPDEKSREELVQKALEEVDTPLRYISTDAAEIKRYLEGVSKGEDVAHALELIVREKQPQQQRETLAQAALQSKKTFRPSDIFRARFHPEIQVVPSFKALERQAALEANATPAKMLTQVTLPVESFYGSDSKTESGSSRENAL